MLTGLVFISYALVLNRIRERMSEEMSRKLKLKRHILKRKRKRDLATGSYLTVAKITPVSESCDKVHN